MPSPIAALHVPTAWLAEGQISSKQIALLAVIVVVTVFMLLSTRRKSREAQNTPRASARDQYKRLKEEKQAINGAQEVMVEMEQLARQIHGQIDTRYAKLEALLRDADRRIAELKRLSVAGDAPRGIDVIVDEATEETDEASSEVQSAPAADVLHAAVHRLADAGLAPPEIAAQEGRTIGEVELILALRKTRRSADAKPLASPASG
jgi:hypothetical protein